MARIALIDPSGRSTTTVQAVLGRMHDIIVRSRIHAPGDCDLVIADLRYDDLADTALLRSLGSFGPVLLLVDRLEPIPASVEEGATLSVLRKPFDAFELRLNVERSLRAVARQAIRPQPPRIEDEDAQWLEFPFVPAPAGAVLRRAARLAAPLWILGEHGSGRRRVAMAVCRSAEPSLRVVTLFPDEQLAAVLERERDAEPFALFVPEIGERPLLEQERLALLLAGRVAFRLIATAVDDPGEHVLSGAFSRNLYQHLIGLAVQLSPLRERPVTIPPLVQALTRRIGRRLGLGGDISFSPDAMARLQTYMWPGNIVELESVLNRTLVHLSDKDLASRVIDVDDLLFMPDDAARPRSAAKSTGLATVARLPARMAQAAGGGGFDEPRAAASRPADTAGRALDIRNVIAGLAHDLRNPMTTIKTFAGTLGCVGSTADDDVRRLGELASEACARIDGYLEALQRYGEMGAPVPRACDLASLARQAIDGRGGTEEMRARLALDQPIPARCDPEQIVYVIENILAALLSEAASDAVVAVSADRGGLLFESRSGRGPVAKLRALLEEGEERAFTWRLLLAAAAAEKNGFVVEEEVAGDVQRVRCRPAGGEVETRDEQAHRTDR
jgi:DNA-binding NtrC family response regulator